METSNEKRMNIAITGEGIVSAIGLNKQEVLRSLLEGKTGIGEMKYLQSEHHELPVGEVKLSNEQMKQMLDISSTQMMSRTSMMGILALRQALDEAGIESSRISELDIPLRIALVSGTTVGGMDITENCYARVAGQVEKGENLLAEEIEFLEHHDCGSSTQEMADYFGFFSEVTTLSTACSSAANAIMLGARMLAAGEADIVVAGGTEALSRFHLNGFNSLMILDHEPCRPFDATRQGLNLGEGAAFVVMESQTVADLRNIKPHAYLTGYGNACDAFHQTASSADGEGAYLAMTEALEVAHLEPTDIQYVNAHGTGTPNNDLSESVALKRVFGDKMPFASSTKSFTGHTTSASGGIETVISILAIQHHFVPDNLGWGVQMADGITPTLGVKKAKLENVLCNSFGFGGNDSSLIISAHARDLEQPEWSVTEDLERFCLANNLKNTQVEIASCVEIDSEEALADIKKYVKPLEVRRMGKLMKSSLLSSLEALEQAGIECPDAIITGTTYGCLENSERLLEQMKEEGEEMLKPTYFMQSTHNTISSNIAIKTHCHGYNVTYTQGKESLSWAIRDAIKLLETGKARNVLVGCHDESTPLFNQLLMRQGKDPIPPVKSIAMVLRMVSSD